jgi:hypothetical protein
MHERKDVEHYNQVLSYLGTRACTAQDVQGTPALLRRILADT